MELRPTYLRVVNPTADDSLGKLSNLVQPGTSVLELGPASGYFTQYLVEQLGCTVDCVELSAAMADRATRYARTMWIANLDEIDLSERLVESGYDYIIAADVLEHLHNPWRTLEMCRPLLRPGGRLLLSIPNVGHAALVAELLEGRFQYRDDGLLDRTHLRFFTRQNIIDLLRQTGFRIETMDAVTWMPERTEFRRTLDELPPTLRANLLRHADAITYQFIVVADVGEMADDEVSRWLKVDDRATPYYCAKLYWAGPNQDFDEDRCVRLYPRMGPSAQTLRFELPPDVSVTRLRLDPADRPGFFHLLAMRILQGDAGGGLLSTVWRAVSGAELAANARLEDLQLLTDRGQEVFLSRSDDPRVFLHELAGLSGKRDSRIVVEVETDWPMSADYLIANSCIDEAVARETGEIRAALKIAEDRLAEARHYQANLEHQIAVFRRPRVDVLVVNFNGDRWVDGFMDSLRGASYPTERLRLIFVDNGSNDESLEHARRRAAGLPFPAIFVQTGRNGGFTGGYAKAFECGDAEYYFVINADTVMASDAISRLVDVLEADPRAGIAEARQSPLEHPKYFDPLTRETSWCSGACMMVREKALRSIGGGFDPSFFMYAEDVDLSWRMWLHGWKCLYVREAVVEHFTEHLDPTRDHRIQHYFSMRNGAVMRVIYGSRLEAVLHYAAMLRVGTLSRNPRWHKWLTLKAMLASVKRLRQSLRKRKALRKLGRSPWVFFDGWLYGRHARDLAVAAVAEHECTSDLLASWDSARRELRHDLPIDQHIVRIPPVHVGGVRRAATLVCDTERLHYHLTIPPGTILTGAVAAPQDAWKPTAVGHFELLQDGRRIWEQELNLGNLGHRRWVPFEAPLQPTEVGQTSQITLCFDGKKDLGWGLWGDIRLAREEEKPEREEWLDPLTGLAVSVVVPTHNRADRVERVIHRLMAQDIAPECFEVILVDSNSKDDTPQVASRLAARYANLKALRCDRSGAAAARNLGLEAARGGLIVLVDDDILVGADFLRQLLRAKHNHPGRVLLGKIIAPWEGSCNPFHRYLLQVQDVNIYDFPDPKNVPANYFYTACVAIPREVLGDQRFDEGFRVYGVEDIEFGFRLLGGESKMVFLPQLQVLHDYYPAFRGYRKKKHQAGYSLGYFLARHPQHADRFQFGQRFRKYYYLLRVLRTLGAPLAGALYLGERLLYQEGPVNRALYRWWYVDLRIELYSGMRRYRRGASPP